jgi:hypothetical protein
MAFMDARIFDQHAKSFLELTTATQALYRQFYHFAVAVTERVAVDSLPAVDAVALELKCFTELLEGKSVLGIERQIGLLGELLFLERFVTQAGAAALDAWLGPSGEPHDFRASTKEFEVKTTLAPRRVHTISGAEQLVPSAGCSLHLISVLLGPAGASNGFTLPEQIDRLRVVFAPSAARAANFEASLHAVGYRSAERANYSRRFTLRRPIGAVAVDASFPAITRPVIQAALGSLAIRIESIQYEVNIEGLEHDDGSPGFESLFTI